MSAFGLFRPEGFWPILIVWTLTMMCYMAAVPMLDAAALQLSARDGTSSGRLRAWGTVGFLMMMVGTGYTALWFGPMASLPLFVGIGVMRALVALGLPAFRAPADAPRPGNAPQHGNATPSGDAPPARRCPPVWRTVWFDRIGAFWPRLFNGLRHGPAGWFDRKPQMTAVLGVLAGKCAAEKLMILMDGYR